MINEDYQKGIDYQHLEREHVTEDEAVELLRQLETSRMMSMLLDLGTSRQNGYLAPLHITSQ